MSFSFETLGLPGLVLVRPRRLADERGWFMEQYKHSEFVAAGIGERFVQDNVSFSNKGVLRGLHFQSDPAAQGKLVTVLAGEVFDVAVDLRPESATYGQWQSLQINADQPSALYVPAGFAHGFLATSARALVCYKCTAEYNRNAEGGIIWNDPTIGIDWPVAEPLVSDKDRNLPRFGPQSGDEHP